MDSVKIQLEEDIVFRKVEELGIYIKSTQDTFDFLKKNKYIFDFKGNIYKWYIFETECQILY